MIYVVQRLLQGLLVLLGVTAVVFGLTFLSGDPVTTLAPLYATHEERALIRERLGLDRPLPVQYADFVARAVQGDFGESLRHREPAMGLILQRMPATLRLATAAILFALLVSVPLGILAAVNHNGPIDAGARVTALLGQSVPSFLLGIVLILIFAVNLRWLPSSGGVGLQSLVLPGITVGAFSAALLARLLRSSLLEALGQDYIRTAHAKGLLQRVVLTRHALRNAALPFTTVLGLQVTFLLSGAVVAETVFAYPGMGLLAVQAIATKDVPVIQAFVTMTAVIVVGVNLIVDLIYARLDPRIRLS